VYRVFFEQRKDCYCPAAVNQEKDQIRGEIAAPIKVLDWFQGPVDNPPKHASHQVKDACYGPRLKCFDTSAVCSYNSGDQNETRDNAKANSVTEAETNPAANVAR
jgi:hypothetical protein